VVNRNPALILNAKIARLPEPLRTKLKDRLTFPSLWQLQENWEILASWKMRYQDERHVPPEVLKVDGLVQRFSGLLECTGAGLCMLAPRQLALAPAAQEGGATYSFAERRHIKLSDGLRLKCSDDFTKCEFDVEPHGPNQALLAEVGNHPIELLAQGNFPLDGKNWYALTRSEFAEANWISGEDSSDKMIDGIAISWRLPMHPGSTYLVRANWRPVRSGFPVFSRGRHCQGFDRVAHSQFISLRGSFGSSSLVEAARLEGSVEAERMM
jgi:hypothetical protein